jgi:hypothetical protein
MTVINVTQVLKKNLFAIPIASPLIFCQVLALLTSQDHSSRSSSMTACVGVYPALLGLWVHIGLSWDGTRHRRGVQNVRRYEEIAFFRDLQLGTDNLS